MSASGRGREWLRAERKRTALRIRHAVEVNDLFGIGRYQLHVVRDAAGSGGRDLPDGFRSAATVLRVDAIGTWRRW